MSNNAAKVVTCKKPHRHSTFSFFWVHNVCEFLWKHFVKTKIQITNKLNKKNHFLNKEIPVESTSNTIINIAHEKRKKVKTTEINKKNPERKTNPKV